MHITTQDRNRAMAVGPLEGQPASRLEVMLGIIQSQVEDVWFELLRPLAIAVPNDYHYFLANCLNNDNHILTTNFDNAIEKAALERGVRFSFFYHESQLNGFAKSVNKKPIIFKLHGTALDQAGTYLPNTIRATLKDVAKGLSPKKSRALELLLKKYHAVFLGYSGMDDFDIFPKLVNIQTQKYMIWLTHRSRQRLRSITRDVHGDRHNHTNKNVKTLLRQRQNSIEVIGDSGRFIDNLRKELRFPCLHYIAHSAVNNWKTDVSTWVNAISLSDRYVIIGDFLDSHGQHSRAISCYTRALRHSNSSISNVHINKKYGWALERKGDYNSALTRFAIAYRMLRNQGTSLEKADALFNLGWTWQRKGDYGKSIIYFQRALDTITISSPDECSILADVHNGLGATFWYKGDWDSAISSFKQSRNYARRDGDIPGQARAFNNIGLAYWKKNANNTALYNFNKSLWLYEKIGNLYGLSSCYSNIAIIYRAQRNLEKALRYQWKAAKLDEIADSKHNLAISWDSIANIYFERNDMDNAFLYYRRCKSILSKVGHSHGLAKVEHHIGRVFFELGNNKYALRSYIKAQKSAKKIESRDLLFDVTADIALLYLRRGKGSKKERKKVFKIGEECRTLAKQLHDNVREAIAERILAQCYLDQLKIEEAETLVRKSVGLIGRRHVVRHERAKSELLLSKILLAKGQSTRAAKLRDNAMALFSAEGRVRDLTNALAAK